MFKDLLKELEERLVSKEAALEAVEAILNTLVDRIEDVLPEALEEVVREAIDKIDGEKDRV